MLLCDEIRRVCESSAGVLCDEHRVVVAGVLRDERRVVAAGVRCDRATSRRGLCVCVVSDQSACATLVCAAVREGEG